MKFNDLLYSVLYINHSFDHYDLHQSLSYNYMYVNHAVFAYTYW